MESSLAYLVSVLRNEFSNFCNGKLERMGLTEGLLFIMLYIGKHPQCSPKRLANDLYMDAGYATRCLSKLEKAGYILQVVNTDDRRARKVELTNLGKEVFANCCSVFYEWDNLVMQDLNATQKTTMLATMQKLLENN